MNTAPHLYILYQQLLNQTQVMLQLAAKGHWDDLIACEMEYVNAVHKLAQLTQATPPTDPQQEQLRPLLRQILDNEQQIRQRLQTRMDELAKLVGQSSIQKSVLTTYGNQGGTVLVPQDGQETPGH